MLFVEIAREVSVLVALTVAAAAPGDAAAQAARSTAAQVCVAPTADRGSADGGHICRRPATAAVRDRDSEPGATARAHAEDDDEDAAHGAQRRGGRHLDCDRGRNNPPVDDPGHDDSAGAKDDRLRTQRGRGGESGDTDDSHGAAAGDRAGRIQALRRATDHDDDASRSEAATTGDRPDAAGAGCARGGDTAGATERAARDDDACADTSPRKSGGQRNDRGDGTTGDDPDRDSRNDGDRPGSGYPAKPAHRPAADTDTDAGTGQTARQIAEPDGRARHPADLLQPGQWSLTLPTGQPGDPDTVEGDDLATFSSRFFQLNDTHDGIVFAANAGGVTTENSNYARSELREMDGTDKAAWSNTSGRHTLELCEAITEVPGGGKPEVVAAQIHDGNDDVLQIRLEDTTLMVQHADGDENVVLDNDYQLGTPYRLTIDASASKVVVRYNGQPNVELPLKGEGWYYKVGAYIQSNVARGADPSSVGEVVVHSVRVTHST